MLNAACLLALTFFVGGNIVLGLDEAGALDRKLGTLFSAVSSRGWSGIGERYGDGTALLVHLVKLRTIGFLAISSVLIGVTLLLFDRSRIFLRPLPDARALLKSSMEPYEGALMEKRMREDSGHPRVMMTNEVPDTFNSSGFTMRDAIYAFLVFYSLLVAYVLLAPFRAQADTNFRGMNLETELTIFFLCVLVVVTLVPHFAVLLLRTLVHAASYVKGSVG